MTSKHLPILGHDHSYITLSVKVVTNLPTYLTFSSNRTHRVRILSESKIPDLKPSNKI